MEPSPQDLSVLFAPRSVAVIGATNRAGSVGQAVFANVFKHGYAGVVYPVNPKAPSVMSVKAFPSVLDIPDAVDLSIIIVPSALVPGVMEECGHKGIKAAIVITAGFKELGGAGVQQEHLVLTAARDNGIRLLGPNCLGIINTDPEVSLNGSFARLMPRPGNIALVSQSGAVGVAALEYAQGEEIGLSKFVSVGNKADLNENDFLAYLKDDPLTDVIMFYLEDLADPKRFFQLAREITGEHGNKKPILAIKSGRTAAGARAASSHTGALAGSDEAYDALFAQCGVLRVESLEELFDYALAFSTQPLPKGNRMAIITNAGGLGIMTTDAAVRYGLEIAEFQAETVAKLKAGLPPAASIHNPVDVLGDGREDRYRIALDGVLGDANVDGVIVISTPQLDDQPGGHRRHGGGGDAGVSQTYPGLPDGPGRNRRDSGHLVQSQTASLPLPGRGGPEPGGHVPLCRQHPPGPVRSEELYRRGSRPGASGAPAGRGGGSKIRPGT